MRYMVSKSSVMVPAVEPGPGVGPQAQVVLDRKRTEHPADLREHREMPARTIRSGDRRVMSASAKAISPCSGRISPEMVQSMGRLVRAVAANKGHNLALAHVQGGPAHGVDVRRTHPWV